MSKVITKPFLVSDDPSEENPPSQQELKKHLPVLKNSDEVESINLSGMAILESGELTRHKYFEFLNIETDDYTDISFTPTEAKRIRGHLAKMSTGHTAMVPMTCSPKCPFRMKCIFFQMGKAPFGRACIPEVTLLQEWIGRYIKEYDVDPNNFTEIGMINELAEIEIYLWRLSQNLAKPEHAELFEENIIGFTPDGIALTNKQISVLLEAKEKLYARRSKIVKLMVGDRQEKYKKEAALKIREESDPSNSMAELRTRLERVSRDLKRREIDDLEASGKLVDAASTPKALSPEDLISED